MLKDVVGTKVVQGNRTATQPPFLLDFRVFMVIRFPSPALLVRRGNPYKIKGFRFFIFLFRRIFWVDLLLLRFTWVYSPIIRTDSTIYANASALWPLIYESFLYLLLPILA